MKNLITTILAIALSLGVFAQTQQNDTMFIHTNNPEAIFHVATSDVDSIIFHPTGESVPLGTIETDETELNNLRDTITDLRDTIGVRDGTIVNLVADTTRLYEHVSDLLDTIGARDGTISDLQDTITARNDTINDLRQRLTLCQSDLAMCEDDDAQMQYIDSLRGVIVDLRDTISDLGDTIAVRDGTISDLFATIGVRDGTISDLFDTIFVRDGTISDLLDTIGERDETILDLKKDIDELIDDTLRLYEQVFYLRKDTAQLIADTLRLYRLVSELHDSISYLHRKISIVSITGISISPATSPTIATGTTLPLTATVFPEDLASQIVTWYSNNPAIATIDYYGVVTAVAVGSTVITATTEGVGHTDTLIVNVLYPAPDVSTPTTNPVTWHTGLTLGNIVGLTANWAWVKPIDTELQAGEDQTFYAIYTRPNHLPTEPIAVLVTVNPADAPSIPPPPTDPVTWSEGLTLGDINLPANWAWVEPTTTALNADNDAQTFYAIYSRPNHLPTNPIAVSVTVNFAPTPTTPTPDAVIWSETLTLGDIQLPTGWTWVLELTTSLNIGTDQPFYANFALANHISASDVKILVTVNAIPTPATPTPTPVMWSDGLTLENIVLPNGWTWVAPATPLDPGANQPFNANFELANHVSASDVPVLVTVNPLNASVLTFERTGGALPNGFQIADITINETYSEIRIRLTTPTTAHPVITPPSIAYTMTVSAGATQSIELEGTLNFDSFRARQTFTVTSEGGQVRNWSVRLIYEPQLQNWNLEAWTGTGGFSPNHQATGWANANFTAVAVPIRNTFRVAGNPATGWGAELRTGSAMERIASGSLFLGSFNAGFLGGYAIEHMNDPIRITRFGLPFATSGHILGMEVDVIYVPGAEYISGTNYRELGSVSIELVKPIPGREDEPWMYHGHHMDGSPHVNNTAMRVAHKQVVFGNSPGYSWHGLPIEVVSSENGVWTTVRILFDFENGVMPDFTRIHIAFASSARGDAFQGVPGSILRVDNIRILYKE